MNMERGYLNKVLNIYLHKIPIYIQIDAIHKFTYTNEID